MRDKSKHLNYFKQVTQTQISNLQSRAFWQYLKPIIYVILFLSLMIELGTRSLQHSRILSTIHIYIRHLVILNGLFLFQGLIPYRKNGIFRPKSEDSNRLMLGSGPVAQSYVIAWKKAIGELKVKLFTRFLLTDPDPLESNRSKQACYFCNLTLNVFKHLFSQA